MLPPLLSMHRPFLAMRRAPRGMRCPLLPMHRPFLAVARPFLAMLRAFAATRCEGEVAIHEEPRGHHALHAVPDPSRERGSSCVGSGSECETTRYAHLGMHRERLETRNEESPVPSMQSRRSRQGLAFRRLLRAGGSGFDDDASECPRARSSRRGVSCAHARTAPPRALPGEHACAPRMARPRRSATATPEARRCPSSRVFFAAIVTPFAPPSRHVGFIWARLACDVQ